MSSCDKTNGVTRTAQTGAGVADVVPLSDRLRAAWSQPLQQVEAYWQAMRNGRNVPARADINPRGIENALEYAFIAERIAPTHGRVRIGGTHLCDLMGMEVRGMPLSAMFVPVSRDRLAQVLQEVFDGPAQVELTLTAQRRLGQPELSGRMLLLPLTDDFGYVSRVLGCLVTDGKLGRAPRRFEIVNAVHSVLQEPSMNQTGPGMAPQKAAGFAEPTSAFKASPKPYLRLVRTDRD